MNDALLIAFDTASLQPWELWLAGSAFTIVVILLGHLFTRAASHRRATRQNTIRIDRHEIDIVKGLRDGKEYPPLPRDPDD